MNKAAPILIVAILGLGLGVVIWWVVRSEPSDPPPDTDSDEQPIVHEDFVAMDFIPTFDLNADGHVTFDEFKQRYGSPLADNAPVLIFHEGDDGAALSAEEAFKRWDRDDNGVVNRADMRLFENKNWREYKALADRKGLKVIVYGDRWMMLNDHQVRAYNSEAGASARKELPFAGKYWAERYLGDWATVTDADGETQEGYLSRNDTRIFLLTSDASLVVFDPAKVSVSEAPPDDPHNLYATEIRQTTFDNTAANLELARKCTDWGMATEADTLYARVLIFEPTNEEALKALGYTEKDGHYTEGK